MVAGSSNFTNNKLEKALNFKSIYKRKITILKSLHHLYAWWPLFKASLIVEMLCKFFIPFSSVKGKAASGIPNFASQRGGDCRSYANVWIREPSPSVRIINKTGKFLQQQFRTYSGIVRLHPQKRPLGWRALPSYKGCCTISHTKMEISMHFTLS